jgi:hypothetical protein
MTWQDLSMLGGRKGGRPADSSGQSSTADVLLQVILPIVLILAFFAFQSAQSFARKTQQIEAQQLVASEEEVRELLERLAREETRVKEKQAQLNRRISDLAGEVTTIELELEALLAQSRMLDAKELEQRESRLQEKLSRLEQEKALLERQQEELYKQEEEIGDQMLELEQEQTKLAVQRASIEQQQRALDERQQEIDEQQRQLGEQARGLEEWWEQLQKSEKVQIKRLHTEALIEVQKQRIIVALEKAKVEWRRHLGISSFPADRVISFSKTGLLVDHDTFSKACAETRKVFAKEQASERMRLRRRVFDLAGLRDSGESWDQAHDPIQDISRQGQVEAAVITLENRNFLEGGIDELLMELRKEAVELQQRAIAAAFEHYRNAPLEVRYQWSADLKRLKEQIVLAMKRGEDTSAFEADLIRQLKDQIRADFDSDDYRYTFLKEAWEQL